MADNQAAYGFRLFTGGFSTSSDPIVSRWPVVSNYSSATPVGTAGVALRPGDPVNLLASGMVQHLTISDGTPTEDTMKCLGVIVGIDPVFNSAKGQFGAMDRFNNLPTGVVYGTNLERQSNVLIVPAEGLTFEADCDDNVTATTLAAYQALVGENCAISYNASAPFANPRIDISTHVTTSEQVRIVGISPTLANQDFSGANVKLLVRWNICQNAPFTATGI